MGKKHSFSGYGKIITFLSILLVNFKYKGKNPKVEQVFLIHRDGRLISYATIKKEENLDEDIISSMLTAVKNLLTIVFVKKDSNENMMLYRFELGEMNIILKMREYFHIAIVIKGKEDRSLLDKFDTVVQNIEDRYGEVLGNWSGEMKDVDGVNEIILKLLPLEELSEEERESIKDKGILKRAVEIWNYLMEED
jgi:hypothetical protein